jgi:hypothetical protein
LSEKTGDLLIAVISFESFPSVLTDSPILKGADRDTLPLRIAEVVPKVPPVDATALIFSVRSFFIFSSFFSSRPFLIFSLSVFGSLIFYLISEISA